VIEAKMAQPMLKVEGEDARIDSRLSLLKFYRIQSHEIRFLACRMIRDERVKPGYSKEQLEQDFSDLLD
jgi:hypothetical protein